MFISRALGTETLYVFIRDGQPFRNAIGTLSSLDSQLIEGTMSKLCSGCWTIIQELLYVKSAI